MANLEKLNYSDFTLKAILHNQERIVQKLQELGAVCRGVDNQIDRYFDVATGKLKWRKGTIENLITHYERVQDSGIEKTIVYRYDLNPTSDEIKKLYDQYQEIGCVRKKRTIFWLDNVKVHLDKLKDGSEFVELEAMDRENRFTHVQLKNQCYALQQALGIADVDVIATGYLK